MTTIVNHRTTHTLARLADFLNPRAHWQRSLWSVGSTFLVSELLDACAPPQSQTLSEESQKKILTHCKQELGRDPAIDTRTKSGFMSNLQVLPHPRSSAFAALRQLNLEVHASYLSRWGKLFEAGWKGISPERAARSLAAYLLDQGISEQYLTDWLAEHVGEVHDDTGLAVLCHKAQEELPLNCQRRFKTDPLLA